MYLDISKKYSGKSILGATLTKYEGEYKYVDGKFPVLHIADSSFNVISKKAGINDYLNREREFCVKLPSIYGNLLLTTNFNVYNMDTNTILDVLEFAMDGECYIYLLPLKNEFIPFTTLYKEAFNLVIDEVKKDTKNNITIYYLDIINTEGNKFNKIINKIKHIFK